MVSQTWQLLTLFNWCWNVKVCKISVNVGGMSNHTFIVFEPVVRTHLLRCPVSSHDNMTRYTWPKVLPWLHLIYCPIYNDSKYRRSGLSMYYHHSKCSFSLFTSLYNQLIILLPICVHPFCLPASVCLLGQESITAVYPLQTSLHYIFESKCRATSTSGSIRHWEYIICVGSGLWSVRAARTVHLRFTCTRTCFMHGMFALFSISLLVIYPCYAHVGYKLCILQGTQLHNLLSIQCPCFSSIGQRE